MNKCFVTGNITGIKIVTFIIIFHQINMPKFNKVELGLEKLQINKHISTLLMHILTLKISSFIITAVSIDL